MTQKYNLHNDDSVHPDGDDDSQLAFFKPNASEANETGLKRHTQNQFQAQRLNHRHNAQHTHSFGPIEGLHLDELYIFDAQIDAVKQDMAIYCVELPEKLEDFLLRFSQIENTEEYVQFSDELREFKALCDKATSREKELYEILGRTENQGLRFKAIDIAQLEVLLGNAKLQLSKMPPLNVIENDALLFREYEQVDARISALSKEILRRSIYERANSIHYAIRPLRSVKSAIYYINRFIQYPEPREYLLKAVRALFRLRQVADFLKNPVEHQLQAPQIQQLQEILRQGSYEWDAEFLDNGSSVWDFGAFHMLKIPLHIVSPHDPDSTEEISLSVIPDYLVHQVRILLNDSGLRKKTPGYHHQNKRLDDH